ncbi:hypothetical protein [Hymenobacter sp. HDW8]|uniref:hypothetical protein n=1 Tax=Hymenobacter sp. HDW8 TaxID=2714932 RepID=UPI00140E7C74|nr:hypothetical protein [Hymenobacter sp. HDW8]QIL74958.1 hypothetical protein G7064_03105 [Hymenobacter sp. HDW8]
MLKDLIKTYKYVDRLTLRIMIVGIIILLTVVSIILLKAYSEIPDFMFAIKNEMIENKSFIDSIGVNNGYAIWFDKDKLERKDTIPFSVSIINNDSVYVKVIGQYYWQNGGNIIYIKQDTLYKSI